MSKIPERVAVTLNRSEIADVCGPLQMLTSAANGVPTTVHIVRLWVSGKIWKDVAVFSLDAVNGFNSISRDMIAQVLKNSSILQSSELAALFDGRYSMSTPLLFGVEEDGSWRLLDIRSVEGTTQGGAASGVFFALGYAPACLATIRIMDEVYDCSFGKDYCIVADCDDVYIGGDSQAAARATEVFHAMMWVMCGIRSNTKKEVAFRPSPDDSSDEDSEMLVHIMKETRDRMSDIFQFSAADNVYNGDDGAFPQFQKDGIMVAKAPVGKKEFMERCAREFFEKFATKCEPLVEFNKRCPQEAYSILRQATAQRAVYMARVLPPDVLLKVADELDGVLLTHFCQILGADLNGPIGESHDVSREARTGLISIPARMGGIGVASLKAFANAAYSASCIESVAVRFFPRFALRSKDGSEFTSEAALRALPGFKSALENVVTSGGAIFMKGERNSPLRQLLMKNDDSRERHIARIIADPVSLLDVPIGTDPSSLRRMGFQTAMMEGIHSERLRAITESEGRFVKDLVDANTMKWSASVLTLTPSSEEYQLTNPEFRHVLSSKLGLPPLGAIGLTEESLCFACSRAGKDAVMGEVSAHIKKEKMGGQMIRRHTQLQAALVRFFRAAGLSAFVLSASELANPDIDSHKIPDIRVSGFGSMDGAVTRDIDLCFVTVDTLASRGYTPTAMVKVSEVRKKTKYATLYPAYKSFGAFAVSNLGGVGEDALEIVNDVADAAVELLGVTRSWFKSRWRKALSCALARAQYEFIRASCAVFHGSAMSGNDWDPHDDSRLNDGEFIDYEVDVR